MSQDIRLMNNEQKKRNPYADMGLMVAIAMIIVTIIKCLLLGTTWESLFWISIAVLYCGISCKSNSQSSLVKHSTTAFLLTSAIASVAIIYIDRKPQPKMHAFEGAKKDSINEEEFIIKEKPVIEKAIKVETVAPDTLLPSAEETMNEVVTNTVQTEAQKEELIETEIESETETQIESEE